MKKLLFLFLIPIVVSFSQIAISPSITVSENFNSLGTSASATLPTNWKADKNTTVKTVGTYSGATTTTNYAGGINLSATAGNGVYNFEVGDGTTSSNRALGGQSSSSASKSVNIYSYFQNTGSTTITQVDISYDVMRFRNGLNTAGFSIQLYYSTDGTTWNSAGTNFLSSFTGPNADNNGAAIVPIESRSILNQTLSGLNISPNGSLYLAWNYSVTSGTTTSNAQALGIDNFIMNNIGGTSTAPIAPTVLSATNITATSFTANWNGSASATKYFLDVSADANFTNLVTGYNNKDVGNTTSYDVSLLNSGTTYYYRLRAFNAIGTSSNSSSIIVTVLSRNTSVQFKTISDAVIKTAGTYNLILTITDPATATTCAVTYLSDSSSASASYINNYSTQIITFPANSSANQNVTLTISNNGVSELPKKAFFQIQNVSGGDNAHVGTISKFKLTITSGTDKAYYSSISTSLTRDALKSALHNLIKGHIKYPYTDNTSSTSIDVWKMLKAADEDPKNPNNIIGIYSGLSIAKEPQDYWNREHVWSKSHGNFGTDAGAGTDGHHLRPENPSVNTLKNNLDFDNGGSVVSISTNCKYDSDSWEPRDEVKGDVARMIFYMATRYLGDTGEPNLQVVDYVPTSPNNEPLYGKLSTLLQWNQQDTVDAFEMNRNNVIYYYQHNRNPFIDHPEWVNSIWGNPSGVQKNNSQIITDYKLSQNYPNPFNPSTVINYQLPVGSYVTLKVFDLLGREVQTLVNEFEQPGSYSAQFSIINSQLSSGIYFYTIKTDNFVQTKKMILIK
jgi:endonuclease I